MEIQTPINLTGKAFAADKHARYPGLRLAVPPGELVRASIPGWNRFAALPVT